MADSKISDLTELAAVDVASSDVLEIVDVSVTQNKKVQVKSLLGSATANFIIHSTGVITTGVKGSLAIPFNCTIASWSLTADVTGSIQIDIWKSNYSSYPPTVSNTISPSNKALISAAAKATSSTLTGWTTTITAGDVLVFNVDSVSTIGQLTIALSLTRT